MRFFTRYNPPLSVGLTFGEGLTSQEFASECDIAQIMARHQVTGSWGTSFAERNPNFGDFSSVEDFQTALNRVTKAREDFEALPSSLRDRFRDPTSLIRFLSDDSNRDEAIRLGLVVQADPNVISQSQPKIA